MAHRPSPSCRWLALPLAGLLLAAPLVAAEPRLDIESDSAEFEQSTGTAIFTGSVIATRGETRLTGERLFARQSAEGLEKAELEGTPGTFFHRDDEGLVVEGHAARIIYDPALERVDLHGDALVKRGREEFAGEHIRYWIAEDRISAAGEGRGRVRTTLYPDEGDRSADNQESPDE